jgi:hypothetical protein
VKEHRITVIITEDEDTQTVKIGGMGSAFLPAPIEKPAEHGLGFRKAWTEFGEKMEQHIGTPEQRATGPWASA